MIRARTAGQERRGEYGLRWSFQPARDSHVETQAQTSFLDQTTRATSPVPEHRPLASRHAANVPSQPLTRTASATANQADGTRPSCQADLRGRAFAAVAMCASSKRPGCDPWSSRCQALHELGRDLFVVVDSRHLPLRLRPERSPIHLHLPARASHRRGRYTLASCHRRHRVG